MAAGYDSCAVIVEHIDRPKTKKKKKGKRVISRDEVVVDPTSLKYMGERDMKKEERNLMEDKHFRKTVFERLREKVTGLWST